MTKKSGKSTVLGQGTVRWDGSDRKWTLHSDGRLNFGMKTTIVTHSFDIKIKEENERYIYFGLVKGGEKIKEMKTSKNEFDNLINTVKHFQSWNMIFEFAVFKDDTTSKYENKVLQILRNGVLDVGGREYHLSKGWSLHLAKKGKQHIYVDLDCGQRKIRMKTERKSDIEAFQVELEKFRITANEITSPKDVVVTRLLKGKNECTEADNEQGISPTMTVLKSESEKKLGLPIKVVQETVVNKHFEQLTFPIEYCKNTEMLIQSRHREGVDVEKQDSLFMDDTTSEEIMCETENLTNCKTANGNENSLLHNGSGSTDEHTPADVNCLSESDVMVNNKFVQVIFGPQNVSVQSDPEVSSMDSGFDEKEESNMFVQNSSLEDCPAVKNNSKQENHLHNKKESEVSQRLEQKDITSEILSTPFQDNIVDEVNQNEKEISSTTDKYRRQRNDDSKGDELKFKMESSFTQNSCSFSDPLSLKENGNRSDEPNTDCPAVKNNSKQENHLHNKKESEVSQRLEQKDVTSEILSTPFQDNIVDEVNKNEKEISSTTDKFRRQRNDDSKGDELKLQMDSSFTQNSCSISNPLNLIENGNRSDAPNTSCNFFTVETVTKYEKENENKGPNENTDKSFGFKATKPVNSTTKMNMPSVNKKREESTKGKKTNVFQSFWAFCKKKLLTPHQEKTKKTCKLKEEEIELKDLKPQILAPERTVSNTLKKLSENQSGSFDLISENTIQEDRCDDVDKDENTKSDIFKNNGGDLMPENTKHKILEDGGEEDGDRDEKELLNDYEEPAQVTIHCNGNTVGKIIILKLWKLSKIWICLELLTIIPSVSCTSPSESLDAVTNLWSHLTRLVVTWPCSDCRNYVTAVLQMLEMSDGHGNAELLDEIAVLLIFLHQNRIHVCIFHRFLQFVVQRLGLQLNHQNNVAGRIVAVEATDMSVIGQGHTFVPSQLSSRCPRIHQDVHLSASVRLDVSIQPSDGNPLPGTRVVVYPDSTFTY